MQVGRHELCWRRICALTRLESSAQFARRMGLRDLVDWLSDPPRVQGGGNEHDGLPARRLPL